jgi:hypothetical protein
MQGGRLPIVRLNACPPDRREVSLCDSPLWSNVVTRIPVRKSFQIILMFRLGLPEWSFRYNLSHNLPGHLPEARTSRMVSSAIRFCSSFP